MIIRDLVINRLLSYPVSYLTTMGNMVYDLNLHSDSHEYDTSVSTTLSEIHTYDLLKPYGRKLTVVERSSKYSRGGRRSANLYRVDHAF